MGPDEALVRGTLGVDTAGLGALCAGCRNPDTCKEWDSVGELTCLCLESIF